MHAYIFTDARMWVYPFIGWREAIDTGTWMDIIQRNALDESIRMYVDESFSRLVGAPAHSGTLIRRNPWRDPIPGILHNVRMGSIPRKNVMVPLWRPDLRTGIRTRIINQWEIKHVGWLGLTCDLITREVLRPSMEVEMLIGTHAMRSISVRRNHFAASFRVSNDLLGVTTLPSLS